MLDRLVMPLVLKDLEHLIASISVLTVDFIDWVHDDVDNGDSIDSMVKTYLHFASRQKQHYPAVPTEDETLVREDWAPVQVVVPQNRLVSVTS